MSRISSDIDIIDTKERKKLTVFVSTETQDQLDYVDSMLDKVGDYDFTIITTTDKCDDRVELYAHDTGREVRRYSYVNEFNSYFKDLVMNVDAVFGGTGRIRGNFMKEIFNEYQQSKKGRVKLM